MSGKQLINVARDINGCTVEGKYYLSNKPDYMIDGLLTKAWIPLEESSDQITNPVLFTFKKKYSILKCNVCVNKTESDLTAKGIRIYYTIDNSLGINDKDKFILLGDFDFTGNYQLLEVPGITGFEASKIIIEIIDASYATARVEEIEFYAYDNSFLLKDENEKYYDLSDDKYNVSSLKYDNLTISTNAKDLYDTYGFNSLSDINTQKNINNESFKPLDKFDKFTVGKMIY